MQLNITKYGNSLKKIKDFTSDRPSRCYTKVINKTVFAQLVRGAHL